MTRAQIVAEAARRLGDETAAFLTDVDKAFDFVLADLAAEEAIGMAQVLSTTDLIGLNQRDYPTRDLTGLTAPHYPDRILSLRVWAWGGDGLLTEKSRTEFEWQRAAEGELARGRPRIWHQYPNASMVQLHPPCGTGVDVLGNPDAGATIECWYLAPPTLIASGTEMSEVRFEDIETIVYGLKARLAPFLDESIADPASDWQLYLAGRARMWGRRHNRGVRQMEPVDQ